MNLFEVMAGVSSDTFKLGGVTFMAAPLDFEEYAIFLTAQQASDDSMWDFLAEKLRRRVAKGDRTDPATITGLWLKQNTPVPFLSVLQHVLLYGKMPDPVEKKAPAPTT